MSKQSKTSSSRLLLSPDDVSHANRIVADLRKIFPDMRLDHYLLRFNRRPTNAHHQLLMLALYREMTRQQVFVTMITESLRPVVILPQDALRANSSSQTLPASIPTDLNAFLHRSASPELPVSSHLSAQVQKSPKAERRSPLNDLLKAQKHDDVPTVPVMSRKRVKVERACQTETDISGMSPCASSESDASDELSLPCGIDDSSSQSAAVCEQQKRTATNEAGNQKKKRKSL